MSGLHTQPKEVNNVRNLKTCSVLAVALVYDTNYSTCQYFFSFLCSPRLLTLCQLVNFSFTM